MYTHYMHTHTLLLLACMRTCTQAKLQESIKLLEDFKEGRLSPGVTNKQVGTVSLSLSLSLLYHPLLAIMILRQSLCSSTYCLPLSRPSSQLFYAAHRNVACSIEIWEWAQGQGYANST